MSAELIYKTTSPAAIAWWRNVEAKNAEQQALRNAFRDEMLAAYGPADKAFYDSPPSRALWMQGERVVGLDSGYKEQPPAGSGWRLDARDGFWKPALKSAAGREIQKRLAALTVYNARDHVTEVGAPRMAFVDMRLLRPGFEFDDETGALYQLWGSGRCAAECESAQAEVPEVEWVEVKRSEWYAREEAKAARNEASA